MVRVLVVPGIVEVVILLRQHFGHDATGLLLVAGCEPGAPHVVAGDDFLCKPLTEATDVVGRGLEAHEQVQVIHGPGPIPLVAVGQHAAGEQSYPLQVIVSPGLVRIVVGEVGVVVDASAGRPLEGKEGGVAMALVEDNVHGVHPVVVGPSQRLPLKVLLIGAGVAPDKAFPHGARRGPPGPAEGVVKPVRIVSRTWQVAYAPPTDTIFAAVRIVTDILHSHLPIPRTGRAGGAHLARRGAIVLAARLRAIRPLGQGTGSAKKDQHYAECHGP